ncbi:hypothetical protein Hypma_006039 [Hypsizygus marmoreus]|uniref:Uncharacterized protein n=1 Tax=Hypsizygus marmoreus TaxID=39966 RepID=A0A369K3P3_HYPMA|nr:hypothetical protein Hypma_006039 [Hypsizygus marmoreus]
MSSLGHGEAGGENALKFLTRPESRHGRNIEVAIRVKMNEPGGTNHTLRLNAPRPYIEFLIRPESRQRRFHSLSASMNEPLYSIVFFRSPLYRFLRLVCVRRRRHVLVQKGRVTSMTSDRPHICHLSMAGPHWPCAVCRFYVPELRALRFASFCLQLDLRKRHRMQRVLRIFPLSSLEWHPYSQQHSACQASLLSLLLHGELGVFWVLYIAFWRSCISLFRSYNVDNDVEILTARRLLVVPASGRALNDRTFEKTSFNSIAPSHPLHTVGQRCSPQLLKMM